MISDAFADCIVPGGKSSPNCNPFAIGGLHVFHLVCLDFSTMLGVALLYPS